MESSKRPFSEGDHLDHDLNSNSNINSNIKKSNLDSNLFDIKNQNHQKKDEEENNHNDDDLINVGGGQSVLLTNSSSNDSPPSLNSASPSSSSNSSSSSSSPSSDLSSKKQAHIISEQKRRQTINEGFSELRRLIPSCYGFHDSKASILRKAANYVRELQIENSKFRAQFQLGIDPKDPSASILNKLSSSISSPAMRMPNMSSSPNNSSPTIMSKRPRGTFSPKGIETLASNYKVITMSPTMISTGSKISPPSHISTFPNSEKDEFISAASSLSLLKTDGNNQ